MNSDDKALATVTVSVLCAFAILVGGILWNALNENAAIAEMVKYGATPTDAACAMGDITACDTSERLKLVEAAK